MLCVLACEDNKQNAHWAVLFVGCSYFFYLFICFWSGCCDRYLPASRHVTVQRGLSVKPAPPKGARCLIRNKCSQTQMHLRDRQCVYACMDLCVFPRLLPSRRGEKTAGSGPRGSRKSSHGHLPVHDASQKTDKPELLFIPHRWSKRSSVLSLIHTPRPAGCAALLTFLVCRSLCSGPSCLVRGGKSTLQQAAGAYVQPSNTWRRVFAPSGKTCMWLQCCSSSKHPLQNI